MVIKKGMPQNIRHAVTAENRRFHDHGPLKKIERY
jgi:hypothetical protein